MSLAPPEKSEHRSARAIVVGVMLAMFLGAIDQTIVATALPTIGRSFGDLENLSWVVTAYLLTATAVTPLYGKLSDIHGRRAMMLIGIGVFIAGSIACAMATSMTMLIVARALQGVGAGGLLPLAQTIIGDVVAPRERGRYQGYIGFVFASATIGGPILGGVLTEHLHWTLIFWINVPLGLIALLVSNNLLKRLPRYERPHTLDLLGAALMMAAAMAFLLAMSWGGTHYPWGSETIVGLLIGSASLWVLFAMRLATAPEPFLPLSILANTVVRWGTASASCGMGVMIGLTIFVPLYFELVLKLSASQSGLALIPLMATAAVSSTTTGRYMGRMRHYKRVPMAGLILAVGGLGLLSVKPDGLPVAIVCLALSCVGSGVGTVFPVTTVAVQNAVPPYQLGTATGVVNFFRQLTAAVMTAVFGAILLSSFDTGEHLSLESIASVSRSGVDVADMFRWVFVAAGLVLLAGLVCLITMEERPLRGHMHDPSMRPPPSSVPAE